MWRRGKQLLYDLAHIVSGFITGLLFQVNPLLAAFLLAVFLIYQFDEDWHIEDQAWRDIREYAVGFYAAGALVLASHILASGSLV